MAKRLRELAQHEAEAERPAAEVRAWLRLLALEPDDARATPPASIEPAIVVPPVEAS